MADDLRSRIAEALCPPHHRVGSMSSSSPVSPLSPCLLHQAQAETVAAVVQPELDRLTTERNQAGVKAQRLHSTLLHFAAEAHRRKWRYDLGEDPHGNQIKSPAFDALHWLGNDLLAALNKTRTAETAEPCCDVPSAAPCEQDDCPGTRGTCGVLNPRVVATCTEPNDHPSPIHRDAFGNTWTRRDTDKPLFTEETPR